MGSFGSGCSLAALVLVCCLAFAPAAEAKRIAVAGVRLGMTQKQVRDVLGSPRSKIKQNVGGVYIRRWRYADRLSVEFGHAHGNTKQWRVERVLTFSPLDSFANGVRVGATLRKVRKAFKSVSCGPNGTPNIIVCQWFLEDREACVPQINFWLRRKRLYKIEVFARDSGEADRRCPRAVRS